MLAIRPLPSTEPGSLSSSRHSSRVYAQDDIDPGRVSSQMKFPKVTGRSDIDSFRDTTNLEDPGYKKYNDEGDARPPAPYRPNESIVDPVSGFVSVGGDIDRKTGHTHIPSMITHALNPQMYDPRFFNSIRVAESAPPELRRRSERDPGAPYDWKTRKVSDGKLRAMLGGWTSERKPEPRTADSSKDLRDSLALQFMYKSSTQRAYDEITWDQQIAPRRWAPVSTYEKKPDLISAPLNSKRANPPAKEWQFVGKSWDRFQTRQCYYKPHAPIPGVSYVSHYPRAQQIPNYSGAVGGEEILEINNPEVKFEPFSVKRSVVPRPSETAHRPDIPRYAGCTLYQPPILYKPMNSQPGLDYPLPTTANVHRPFGPVPSNESLHKKLSQMSRMVTTVPPSNPFNRINKDQLEFGEKSEKLDIGQAKTAHPHNTSK